MLRIIVIVLMSCLAALLLVPWTLNIPSGPFAAVDLYFFLLLHNMSCVVIVGPMDEVVSIQIRIDDNAWAPRSALFQIDVAFSGGLTPRDTTDSCPRDRSSNALLQINDLLFPP